jgi:hypothetical protein
MHADHFRSPARQRRKSANPDICAFEVDVPEGWWCVVCESFSLREGEEGVFLRRLFREPLPRNTALLHHGEILGNTTCTVLEGRFMQLTLGVDKYWQVQGESVSVRL